MEVWSHTDNFFLSTNEGFNIITCHQVTDYSSLVRVPYWGPVLVSAVTDLALSNSFSQISLGEWRSILSRPSITFITATMATLFKGLLCNNRDSHGWGWSFREHVILSTWLLNCSSAEVILQWTFTWNTSIFTSFAHLERSSHKDLPQVFLIKSQSWSFQVPDQSQNIHYSPWIKK